MKKKLIVIFDVLFVMILCFATLLTTMILQGGLLVGGDGGGLDYNFNMISFGLTAGGLFLYLIYVLKSSDKELRKMINHIHKNGDSRR